MANGQQDDQSGVPLPIIPIPLGSGATDQPNAPQLPVESVTGKTAPTAKTVKPFGTTPQKVDYDPNFPLLSRSKGFAEAMKKYEDEPGPEESTLPKSVIMQRQLNVMESSPIYKQANSELRLRLQMAFYKQYVEPLARLDAASAPQGQRMGQHPLTLQDWLKARGQVWLRDHPNPKVQTSDLSKVGLSAADELFVKTAAGVTDLTSEAVEKLKWDNVKKQWFNLKSDIGAAGAMLNAQLTPHMGPILIQGEHKDLDKVHYNPDVPGMGMNLDELYNASEYAQHNYYRNTAYDQLLLKGGGRLLGIGVGLHAAGMVGEAAGGLRAVDADKLLAFQTPEEIAAARKLYAGSKLFGRFGVYAGDVGKHSIEEAAKGYVVGTVQRGGHPVGEAIGWGGGSLLMTPVLDGVGLLIGKLRVWGDQEVTSEMLDKAVSDYLSKHPSSQVTPAAVAMAGSPGQKISRGLMEALNKETKGAFWTAPLSAKQSTLAALAKKYPDLAANAGWLDEHLTELQALHETAQWRELMPEADKALKELEQIDGVPTSKTIAKEVAEKERAEYLKKAPPGTVAKATQGQEENRRIADYIMRTDAVRERIKAGGSTGVPGAASAGSLEFSDNFTKHIDNRLNQLGLGKDKYTWESRGHKLLFYLNVLASETKAKGPSTELSQEAQLLLHQLTQEFPNKNLKELLGMSDKLWKKISDLERGGFVKPGVPTRIFRQTHLEPGESPFAHEVDLLQKAAKADRAKRIEAAKATKEAKAKASTEAKAKEAEKIATAPTESKEMQTAMGQYIAALKKLGYTNDDIKKMTPQQLVEIISKKTPKVAEAPKAPAPPVEKPKAASVKMFVTKKDEADLKAAGFTQEKINSMKPADVQEALAEVERQKQILAGAFKKTSDVGTGKIDQSILTEVRERMFPGQAYGDLTPAEQSELNQVARKLQLSREKGKK